MMARHIVTTNDTYYAILNADGTLIYGTAPAGTNISTGQPVCKTSVDDGGGYYDLIAAEAVPWEAGASIGNSPVSYGDDLYQPIQPHTAQADWPPDLSPALFRKIPKPVGGYEPWVQPTGGHDAYALDAIVTHNGQVWRSTVANNVWEPGVYGWTVID